MPTLGSSGAPQSARRDQDALSCLALGAVVVVGPQLLGGVYPWGMLAISTGGLVALGLATWGNLDLRPTPLSWAMLGALAWTLIQALPLPRPLSEWVAPESFEQLRRSRDLLGAQAPSWCAISRDPAGTREEVVKGIAIVSAFMTALGLSRHGYRRWVYGSVAVSGILMALVAVAHAALGAKRVFGLYTPVPIREQAVLAPLLNLNTLGGFLAMCVPVVMGLALTSRTTRMRVLLLLAIGLLGSCALMTRSRGGVGALIAGSMLFGLLAWRRPGVRLRDRNLQRITRRFGLPAGIAVALAVGAYGWYQEVIQEFRAGEWDKFDLIARGAAFALRHPWLGVGRGAFGSTFAAVHNATNRFVHAENFVVQWASEWGLPVAFLLLAALAHALIHAARRTRSLDRLGAIVGIAVIAAQNLVDIGFELVGVSVVVSALLGAAMANRQSRRKSPAPRPWFRRPAVACLAGATTLVASLATVVDGDYSPYLKQQLEKRLAARDRAGFSALLGRALEAHPSEPMFPLLAGSEALLHRDQRAGRWINRAMQLAPGWAGPHLQAAQWLWNSGRHRQALLELSIAASIDPYESGVLTCPVVKADPLGVAAIVARGANRALVLELASQCARDTPIAASKIDAILMAEQPHDPRPWLREARRRLARGDAEGALTAAEAARQRAPKEAAEALGISGRALRSLGRADDALSALRRAQRAAPDSADLIAEEAELLGQRGDREGMRAAFERLRGLAGGSASELGRAFMLEAAVEERFGDAASALRAYEQAYRIADDTSALNQIARIAERLGSRRQAAWAYAQLCNLASQERDACAKRDALIAGANTAESPAKAAQPSQK